MVYMSSNIIYTHMIKHVYMYVCNYTYTIYIYLCYPMLPLLRPIFPDREGHQKTYSRMIFLTTSLAIAKLLLRKLGVL